MERHAQRRVQGVGALVVLVVIAVGVPALLVRIAGWPLPRSMPDFERVRVALVQGDIPAETVVKVLAIIVWLIWLQVMWALAWEVVVNVPRLAAGHRPSAAPLVVGPVGNGVGRLVALVMSIGLTVASIPSTAVALPRATASVGEVGSVALTQPASPPSVSATASFAPAPRWRVETHDSLWRIAEAALGEGDRSNEILELNAWLTSPRDVRAGHVLVLPADAVVPEDRRPAPDPEPVSSSDESVGNVTYLAPTHIVIETGDTLWDLSEDRLAIVDTDVAPHETLDLVNEVIALNPEVVEDPNLIYPGEVFAFPAVGIPPAPEVVVDEPQQPIPVLVDDPIGTEEVHDAIPLPTESTVAEQPVGTTLPPTAPATTASTPPIIVDAEVEGGAGDPEASESQSVAPWVAGLSGATVLASSLLVMYRRRLSLRASRGARAYRSSAPDDPTVLTALARAADVSLLCWANHELATLFAGMTTGELNGMPLAVELSREHGIELLWTDVNPVAPSPWHATDDGWSWRLAYDEDQPLPSGEQAAVLPALVTIGTRDGNQLLLNLEAVGCIAVDASNDVAEAFARSIIVELAAGELLSDTYLACSDIDLDGAHHFDRIEGCTASQANERLARAVRASSSFLTDARLSTSFEARLSGDADGREATVVVLPAARADGAVLRELQPGLGACAVLIGRCDESQTTARFDTNALAVLEPFGLDFEPALLPLETIEAVDDLLDEATEPLEQVDREPIAYAETGEDAVAAEPELQVPDLGEDDGWEMPVPTVLVRVLGAPEVVGFPQMGRIETSILAYLACHRGQRTAEQIVNAVWNGRLVESKTLWNKISKIRAALGPDLVPARQPNSAKVVVAAGVMSDLDMLRTLADRAAEASTAEALALLLRGLELVDGVPFDSPDYEWAYETQQHAGACELVERVAVRCARLALELGDITSARTAVAAGLRAVPLNEPLYRERMRVESAAGSPEGVRRTLADLRNALSDPGAGSDPVEPDSATLHLAAQLDRLRLETHPRDAWAAS